MATEGNHEIYKLTWPDGKYWVGLTLPSPTDKPIYFHYSNMGRHPEVKIVQRFKTRVEAKQALADYYAAKANDQNLLIHEL